MIYQEKRILPPNIGFHPPNVGLLEMGDGPPFYIHADTQKEVFNQGMRMELRTKKTSEKVM